jgi:hypothetical protein
LKEVYKAERGYAHEKTETTVDVIKQSKAINFKDLSNIQATQVTKREFKSGKIIRSSSRDIRGKPFQKTVIIPNKNKKY